MSDIDHAAIGRVYADNLLGEPAVSRCLHAMADEIERLRNGGACPHVRGTVTQHCSLNFTLTDEEREAVGVALQCVESARCQKHPEELAATVLLSRTSATLHKMLERLGDGK